MATGTALALTLVAGAISAKSAYDQGKAQEANQEYNAKLQRNQAKQTEMEAIENARRGKRNAREQLAAIRARAAARGQVANSGAPLQIMGAASKELALGVQDAYRSQQIERSNLYSSAKISRWQGKDAARAGKLMAFGSLVGTGAQAFGNFQTGKRSGAL